MTITAQGSTDLANAKVVARFGLLSGADVKRGAISSSERAVFTALLTEERVVLFGSREIADAAAVSVTATLAKALQATGYLKNVPTSALRKRLRVLADHIATKGFPTRNDAKMRRDYRLRIAIICAISNELADRDITDGQTCPNAY